MRRPLLYSWIAGLAMLLCALLSYALRPVAAPQQGLQLEALIPTQFAGWQIDPTVVPVIPSADVQANLAMLYSQIVSRTYVNEAGERMMLVVAYGGDQSDSLKAHRQEVCYQAQGFAIREVRRDALALGSGSVPLVRVHAQNGLRSEPISYWFTMGQHVAIGRAERLWTQIAYGLGGTLPDGLLLRVSSLSSNTVQAYGAQDRFLQSLLRAVPPSTRTRLAGADASAALQAL